MEHIQDSPNQTTRVLIMDVDPDVRSSIREMLLQDKSVEIVGEASNAIELLAKMNLTQPNVIVTNLSIGGGGHLRVLNGIKSNHPEMRVIAVTIADSYEYFLEVPETGGTGCLVKTDSPDVFLSALHSPAEGSAIPGKAINPMVLGNLTAKTRNRLSNGSKVKLTRRESEILNLLAEGKSNTEISRLLSLKPSTVRTHRSVLVAKLGLPDRTDLIKLAVSNNYLKLNDTV